jgi:hypothetical protein
MCDEEEKGGGLEKKQSAVSSGKGTKNIISQDDYIDDGSD